MQKRTRRPHGIGTRKISISISADDLRVLTARARAEHGGNLSAVVHDLAASLRREIAMDDVLEQLNGQRIDDAVLDGIRKELLPKKRRRKKAAAA